VIERKMQTAAPTVNHLVETLQRAKVLVSFNARRETGSVSQRPGAALAYDDVYFKLFREKSRSERWGSVG
jgi:hypothetical protein